MGRRGVVSPLRSRGMAAFAASAGLPTLWPVSRNLLLVGLGLLLLIGIVVYAVLREATARRVATSMPAQPAEVVPRPPLTRAEEAYIQALWPIHGHVERSAVRMSLGQILYKTGDLGRAELKGRVDRALAAYRGAEARLLALEPPPSLQREHESYLTAVQLFQKSALEVLKMFEDGSDEHLRAAYPLGLQGSNKIREVGVKFWPNEFPPN